MSFFLFKKKRDAPLCPVIAEAGFHPSMMLKRKEEATEGFGEVFERGAAHGRQRWFKWYERVRKPV